jgi:hypothetical protein
VSSSREDAQKAKTVKPRFKKKKKVWCTKDVLEKVTCTTFQTDILKSLARNFVMHGVIAAGDSNSGWQIKFDLFGPITNENPLVNIIRKGSNLNLSGGIGIVDETDLREPLPELCDLPAGNSGRISTTPSTFDTMEWEKIRNFIGEVNIKCNKEDISWTVHNNTDRPKLQTVPPLKPEFSPTDIDFSATLQSIFFQNIFPSVTGHAKKIDKYLADKRAAYHTTMHPVGSSRPEYVFEVTGPDPDIHVKTCWMLLLAQVLEVETEIDNLWKKGESDGLHDYADFGRFIPMNMFKAFASCAMFMWADEDRLPFPDVDDHLTWDVFTPMLDTMVAQRKKVFARVIAISLDESMIEWRPKTSKSHRLPNISYVPTLSFESEARSGTKLINGAEMHQDITMAPPLQRKKEFCTTKSVIPGVGCLPHYVAEVLRQAHAIWQVILFIENHQLSTTSHSIYRTPSTINHIYDISTATMFP